MTYFEKIFFSSRTSGGKLIEIGTNESNLFELTAPGSIENNITQNSGSYATIFSFFFAKLGTNTTNFTGENHFIINGFSTNETYFFKININPELYSFYGLLIINVSPIVNVTLTPNFWIKSGLIDHQSISYFNLDLFIIFGIFEILFIFTIYFFKEYRKFAKIRNESPKFTKFKDFLTFKIKKRNKETIPKLSDKTLNLLNEIQEENIEHYQRKDK